LRRNLLIVAGLGILWAAAAYIGDVNKCFEPYAYELNNWPPSYDFWCRDLGWLVGIGTLLGPLLFIGGLIFILVDWVKSKL